MDAAPAIAAIRFGLGRTPGQDPAPDPVASLHRQLANPEPGPDAATLADAFDALAQDREARFNPNPPTPRPPPVARTIFRRDVAALLNHAVTTTTPFHERLVWFWANHFTVSIRQNQVTPLAGAFVHDAIRPHVTGRFADMLLAVMRHPAMLIYLDNAQSAGPGSKLGVRNNRGLNENLARECLELHTCTPAAGYTQPDVTAFARVLTGWSVERRIPPVGFRFRPNLHQPGAETVMGRRFPEGEQGGIEALAWLASHPATHRHLATKLVRHFVADQPPPGAVNQVEATLRDTGGDLGAAARELLRIPAAWQPLTKLRTPQDYVVAALRAAALPAPDAQRLAANLGQPPFAAPFPIGWPDTAADWAGPEAMMRRVDWAYALAGHPGLPEPLQLADTALGPLLTNATATEIRRAGSRRDAAALLLASPEFNRR